MIKDSIVPQSYKGLTLEEARVFLRNTMDLFQSLSSMADLKTMYEAGKQLSRLYFDCANHQRELAEILLELEFPEYTIKTMKKLNNMGVFKNDDIWFSSFYFYNICWNYSDASFEFATALALCGLPNLLNLNIGHKPYLDNLSSRNVYYLIKASLSIIHNICRFPGSCIYFRSESVKSSLLNLINREEDFIRVVASLCLASIVGENEPHLLRGGGDDNNEERPDVMQSIIGYIRKARHSERGRFMGFRSYELLQGIRSATTVECEKRHFIDLDGIGLLKESLVGKVVIIEEDVAECLEILCNLSINKEFHGKLLEAGLDLATIGAFAGHENTRIRTAAQDYLWSMDSASGDKHHPLPEPHDDAGIDLTKPLPVYVSYASINRFSVLKIRDRLADANIVRFIDSDVRASDDAVKKAIRKSALVIICVSEAFKSHPHFQLEVDFCERIHKPIVPLLIQQKYRPEGWLQRAIERDLTVFDLSSKRDFETSWETFMTSIGGKLKEIKAEYQRQLDKRVKQEKVEHHEQDEYRNSIDDMSRSQHLVEPLPTLCDGGYRRYNGAENNVDSTDTGGAATTTTASRGAQIPKQIDVVPQSGAGEGLEAVANGSGGGIQAGGGMQGGGGIQGGIQAWLEQHELAHLRPQIGWLNSNLLRYYQNVKKHAPEYFYQTLEKQLKLEFVDILKFSNAIDHL